MITFKQFLLLEAREDLIAQKQEQQILMAYKRKDANGYHDDQNTALDIVEFLSRNTIPVYIQWVTNQYIKDANFKMEDLPEVKNLLLQFDQLKKAAGNLINKDINSYKSIDILREKIQKALGQDITANTLIAKYAQVMKEYVDKGEAEWKHNSSNLKVYTPKTYEASKALREVAPNDISLCVTYLDSDQYFNQYLRYGIMDFVLTTNQLYLLFFNTKEGKGIPSEFADRFNKHETKDKTAIEHILLKHHPELRQILKPDYSQSNFLEVQEFYDIPEDEKIEQVVESLRNNLQHIWKIFPYRGLQPNPKITKALRTVFVQMDTKERLDWYETHLHIDDDTGNIDDEWTNTMLTIFKKFFPTDSREYKEFLYRAIADMGNYMIERKNDRVVLYITPREASDIRHYGLDMNNYNFLLNRRERLIGKGIY